MIELSGIGPTPFVGMLLADLGADVIRIDPPGGVGMRARHPGGDLINRGKRSIVLDIKGPGGLKAARALAKSADVLIEGFRPGVAERLGLGPDDLLAENPTLIYGRMTGWGQNGPLAQAAGHDITYIAITGALHAIGPRQGPPSVPLNLIGDLGGGALYLVVGILAALHEASVSGRGQVVDAAMVDGAAHLMSLTYAMLDAGQWEDRREANLLDGHAPFYTTYETSDGGHMAVGALEPKFFSEFLRLLGVGEQVGADEQYEEATWPRMRDVFATAFARRTRAEWTDQFEGTDACVAPVLSLTEAAGHPHLAARGTLIGPDRPLQAAPAPRFSRHPVMPVRPVPRLGEDTASVLGEIGISPE